MSASSVAGGSSRSSNEENVKLIKVEELSERKLSLKEILKQAMHMTKHLEKKILRLLNLKIKRKMPKERFVTSKKLNL